MAEKKDTPPERRRTKVRIVNLLAHIPNAGTGKVLWEELTKEYKSSADAKKGQDALGAGTYQVAHLFGGPETLNPWQPKPVLLRTSGVKVPNPAQPATEADDD